MKSHMGQDKNSDAKDHSAIPTSLFQSALMANTGATQQMKGDLEGSESFTRALGEVGQANASPGDLMEQLQDLLPAKVIQGLMELGYDSPQAITASVQSNGKTDDWIKMLFKVFPEWLGTIPQEAWELSPMAGKLRLAYGKCVAVAPYVDPQGQQTPQTDQASGGHKANTVTQEQEEEQTWATQGETYGNEQHENFPPEQEEAT